MGAGNRSGPTLNLTDSRTRLKEILDDEGTRAAVAYLNGLTWHRFTALYRFDRETLRNLYFFDREHPEVESSPDIPITASYCVFVRDNERTFALSDSFSDGRVEGHPKRPQIRSYCGVPLVAESGRMFGTICHFDLEPLNISDETVSLMEAVAPLLEARSRRAR